MGNDRSRAPYQKKPEGEKLHTNAEEVAARFREILEEEEGDHTITAEVRAHMDAQVSRTLPRDSRPTA